MTVGPTPMRLTIVAFSGGRSPSAAMPGWAAVPSQLAPLDLASHLPLRGDHWFRPRVAGLIDAELPASRQLDLGQHPPTWVLHWTACDAAILHLCDECLDIVADQKQFVNAVLVGRVHGHFCGREPEDQPSTPHVDVR